MSAFTDQPQVKDAIQKAQKLRSEGRRFSDIEDTDGNQYIDLVQEGGGVLGIALVGYTHVLESAGIRFMSLAGTSAGAINTMMIAGLGKVGDPVSEKILKLLSEKNLFDFVDGDASVKKILNKAINGEGIGWDLALRGIKIYKILKKNLGINPGINFTAWVQSKLAENNIKTIDDLEKFRKLLPGGLKHTGGKDVSDLAAKLAIITSDITTHTKVEFPRMSELYFNNPKSVSPALMVRASMSVPYFFEPFMIRNIPNAGKSKDKAWVNNARYYGEVPTDVRFVDGGMLSNFPINVFHRSDGGVPRMPTLGVRLSTYREGYSKADSLLGMSGAMVSTMRQIHDYDFLLKNPDYSRLICKIDADAEFNWLNFNMSRERQVELFALGAKKAIEFLEGFDWEDYKKLRKRMSAV